ncbi:MAG: sulfotransferase domain-containing protein [Cyanobacteria bacterium P01_H01_bin.58]
MVLPNFLIVGAMKAGTSWLAFNLTEHPQVFMPDKELHFFNDEKKFERGLQWYASNFAKAGNTVAIGEKTAGYLLNQETPERLAKLLDNPKIIMVLRDPVKRAISQINHHMRYGDIPPDKLNPDNWVNSEIFSRIDKEFAILERGRYLEQVKRYYSIFDADNILVLINEIDIQKESEKALARTCKFLGVDSTFKFESKEKKIHNNKNSKLGTLLAYRFSALRPLIAKIDRFIPGDKIPPFKPSKTELKKLYEIYQEDNQRLFDFFERDLPATWKGI